MIRTHTRITYANGYLELGMLKEARAELKAITPEEQDRIECFAMWSKYFLAAKDWKRLAKFAKQMAKTDPDDSFGWINWAYALREMEKISEAKSVALDALDRHPKEPVLWYNLACYCVLGNDLETARQHLDRAIALNKSFEAESKTDPDLAALLES